MAVLRRECDADTGVGVQPMAENFMRSADVFQDARAQTVGKILTVPTHLQDGELIAAEAANEITRA